MFQLNIWKSVEFEMPVIKVGGLSDLDAELSEKMSKWILTNLERSGINTHMINHIRYAKPSNDDQYTYLLPATDDKVFDARHRIMGVSEIAFEFPDTEAIVLNDAFRTQDIRDAFNVLVVNAEHPFYADQLAPVGHLLDFRKTSNKANVVFVADPKNEHHHDELTLNSYLKPDSSIYFVNDLGTKIEVLQDGDKFAAEFKQFIDQSK